MSVRVPDWRTLVGWPAFIAVSSTLVAVLPGARTLVPTALSGVQSSVYGALVGTAGTLLGFTLAALAFLVALPEEAPLMRRLKASKAHKRVLEAFASATVYLGLLLLVALLGLVIDREPEVRVARADIGGWTYWSWSLVAFGVPAAALVARATGGLLRTVPLVLKAGAGRGPRNPPPP